MSIIDHLVETRTALDLARDLVKVAKDNAALLNEVHRLKHELFWLTAETKQTEKP
jgi:hypothetical protein